MGADFGGLTGAQLGGPVLSDRRSAGLLRTGTRRVDESDGVASRRAERRMLGFARAHRRLWELQCRPHSLPFVSSTAYSARRGHSDGRFLFHASVYLVLRRGEELLMARPRTDSLQLNVAPADQALLSCHTSPLPRC